MSHPSAFKTPEGEAAFLAAYDAAMKLWPVPYEEMDIPSRFGMTHVVASGPTDAPPLVLLHGYMAIPTLFSDDQLRAMRVPTLLLMGDHEVVWDPVKALARARRLLPDFQGELVPRSSHDMCVSQHTIVDARVLGFLDDKRRHI